MSCVSVVGGGSKCDDVGIKPISSLHLEPRRTPLGPKIGIVLSFEAQHVVNRRHFIHRYCGVNSSVKYFEQAQDLA